MTSKQAWSKRNKLRDEGYKLRAEGDKLYAERDKLYAEHNKLCAERNKLCAEGNILFFTAVIAEYGNVTTEWTETGCRLGNGVEFKE